MGENENCSLCNVLVVIQYSNKEFPIITKPFTEHLGNYICKECIEQIVKDNIHLIKTKGTKKYSSRITGYEINNFHWYKGKEWEKDEKT